MIVRRVLILIPTLLILILVQSYFWVPTYEQQTRGNPNRLNEYIVGSIGDAGLLNPILSADSASSDIESMVFEGLIDRDEQLRFRGRLATAWKIYEEASFFINETAKLSGLDASDPQTVVDLIQKAQKKEKVDIPQLQNTLANIDSIQIIPPHEFSITRQIQNPEEKSENTTLKINVEAPAGIKLILKQVDQNIFKNLAQILGKDYFNSFSGRKYLSFHPQLEKKNIDNYAREIIPATQHNPILLFHLRPNVRFHDGHVFDADDVKFTYESIINPKNLSPRIADYEPVKEVEVLDPQTVKIVYKRLYAPAIGTWSMGILPEHRLNPLALTQEARRSGVDNGTFTMRQSSFNRHPIGCGPFKFNQWKSDQYIALDRFEDYWEGPPNYNRYVYRIIPDLLTQEMEFYAGTIDSYNVQPHQVGRLSNDTRYQNFSGTSFGYTYIGYNLRREPFDDIRIRRALSMAIDVDKIIDFVLYGQGERITGPFIKQSDYYNHSIQPIAYDPEGALKLLKKAGWNRNEDGWLEKNGKKFQFTLISNSGNDLRKAILAIAQDAWKKIGIDVRTDLLEWSVFIQERVDKADFDALILGWQMGIEPDLFQIWHSSQTNPYQLNFVGFKNKKADDLIIKIRQEYNHDKQVQYCHQLHEIIAGQQPYTFLYVGKWTSILDKRIVIKEIDSDGRLHYEKIKPTLTGNYSFHFNKWIKLPVAPHFMDEG